MKKPVLPLLMTIILPLTSLNAAVQLHPMSYRIPVYGGPQVRYEQRHDQVGFKVEIISDKNGLKSETVKQGRPFIVGEKDERYSIRLYNPLPVRVAVNLTVDGLNSITGKPEGIAGGAKWMIDPYSFITISGWQVNQQQSRRFFFTNKPLSYAAWQGERLDKDLSANCGVIGAAYFWNKKELAAYYEQHPLYEQTRGAFSEKAKIAPQSGCDMRSPYQKNQLASEKKFKDEFNAGTGMGERESNPTTLVEFHYDTGMTRAEQAVLIFYDFKKEPQPNPFPTLEFSAEMPS